MKKLDVNMRFKSARATIGLIMMDIGMPWVIMSQNTGSLVSNANIVEWKYREGSCNDIMERSAWIILRRVSFVWRKYQEKN
jgi:hypothetical protein